MWTCDLYDLAADLNAEALYEFITMITHDLRNIMDYEKLDQLDMINAYLIYLGSRTKVVDIDIELSRNSFKMKIERMGLV